MAASLARTGETPRAARKPYNRPRQTFPRLTGPAATRTLLARRGVAPDVQAVSSSSDAPVPRQPTGL
ncbi:hypothetical protein GCM10007164_03830 [Luteimonas padinae]|nr:hypothetical protein GCM10007164_03830 [Luteimonas padinae]